MDHSSASHPHRPAVPYPHGTAPQPRRRRRPARQAPSHRHRNLPTLATKNVTPHTLRYSAAMALPQAGIDTATIALWLGHANPKSTDIHLHADLALKERALARTVLHEPRSTRYKPTDSLLAFLENL
ncbi:tyrosine-type recombinase/integrase [[Actinomadura] parvosata]